MTISAISCITSSDWKALLLIVRTNFEVVMKAQVKFLMFTVQYEATVCTVDGTYPSRIACLDRHGLTPGRCHGLLQPSLSAGAVPC